MEGHSSRDTLVVMLQLQPGKISLYVSPSVLVDSRCLRPTKLKR